MLFVLFLSLQGSVNSQVFGSEPPQEESQNLCSICLEECRDPAVTECSHVVHRSCLGQWFQEGTTRTYRFACPVCRCSLEQASRSYVLGGLLRNLLQEFRRRGFLASILAGNLGNQLLRLRERVAEDDAAREHESCCGRLYERWIRKRFSPTFSEESLRAMQAVRQSAVASINRQERELLHDFASRVLAFTMRSGAFLTSMSGVEHYYFKRHLYDRGRDRTTLSAGAGVIHLAAEIGDLTFVRQLLAYGVRVVLETFRVNSTASRLARGGPQNGGLVTYRRSQPDLTLRR